MAVDDPQTGTTGSGSASGGRSDRRQDPDADDLAGGDVVTAGRDDVILSVEGIRTTFFTDRETIHAVDGVSFDIRRGETVGIVGESGSGKSVTARTIMGLVDSPGRIVDGAVKYRGLAAVRRFADRFSRRTFDRTAEEVDADADPDTDRDDEFVVVTARDEEGRITDGYVDVTDAPESALRKLRGGDIAMVFQDPLTSLNPVYTVGNQIREALRLHQSITGTEARKEAIELLEAVGIPDAGRRVGEYPHQFSGGMRQRAVIAMALACDPELLICDEPTTALDVTIQAQILELLEDLQRERDLAIMFITHDMGVIAETSDRVNVMYAGEIVESAPVEALFARPRHPYTRGLLESIPGRNPDGERFRTIEGEVPTPTERATDCRFAPRCPEAFEACEAVHPVPVAVGEGEADHTAACLLYPDDEPRKRAVERHRAAADGDRVATDATPDGGGRGRADTAGADRREDDDQGRVTDGDDPTADRDGGTRR
jgi:peptide/nickel transport system ATP-binding protein